MAFKTSVLPLAKSPTSKKQARLTLVPAEMIDIIGVDTKIYLGSFL